MVINVNHNMKTYIVIAFIALLAACSEADQIGQYAVDSVPPGPVSDPVVENTPGGAIITYTIPNDMDLLYTKATYQRNGATVEQKASVFSNRILIEGLGRAQRQPVTLVAYDRSHNASTPVTVNIEPLDAPIYTVLNTITVENDFGGIRLNWENPGEADVVITVLTMDDQYGVSEVRESENFYTKAKTGIGHVRGYVDDERWFGVYLRDRWNNVTDTMVGTYNPIFEVQLDKSQFRRWNPPGIPYNAYTTSNWWIENLWNGLTGEGIRAGQDNIGLGFANLGMEFTFDMGVVAKLSRFKINQRPEENLIYNLGHPRRFQLWGSASPNVNQTFDGWVLLGEFASIKPSGLPLGSVNDEDIRYANAIGEDWNVPLEAPPVRYLRFVCLETWAQASMVQVMEMTLWGDNSY